MQICGRRLAAAETMWRITTRLGSFGTTLGLILNRDGGKLTPRRIDDAATEWSVPWPQWASRSDGKLCLATALALADEVSSYGGMSCWDNRCRAGLTLSISARLVGHEPPSVAPGEELHFVSRKLKTGRQLGYMELEVWRGSPSDEQYYHQTGNNASAASSSAELLAVGRHSKMLNVPGPLFAFLKAASHPKIFPILQPPVMRLFESRYPDVVPWPKAGTSGTQQPAVRADVFPPLRRLAEDVGEAYAPVMPLSAPLRLPPDPRAAPPSLFVAKTSPTWGNLLGNCHGGAACILGEQAAAQSYCETNQVEEAPPAKMMIVNIMSGLVCDGRPVAFEAVSSEVKASAEAERQSLVALRHASDSGRAVECAVWW